MSIITKSKTNLVIFIILIINVISIGHVKYWSNDNKIIVWDVISYYSYLPATFIEKDLSLDFVDKDKNKYGGHYWPHKTEENRNVIKMTMGMSFLYAPFFFIGHGSAHVLGYETDGFSNPYRFALILASLVYLLIGLFYARKVLRLFFDEKITAYTLLFIGLGTNLYFYSAFANAMPHLYNFTLFSMFVYYSIKWHYNQAWKYSLFMGLLLGIITLIRPTNSIIILFFLLYNIHNIESFKAKMRLYFKNFGQLLFIPAGVLLFILPQLFYWNYATGHWVYYSYQDESFFFANPQIYDGLFSFRKGWFVYTPIMFFAFFSIPVLYRKAKSLFMPVMVFSVVNIYFIFSWWCWWYGGSFGQRPMIDSYIILAFPLAVFISRILKGKKLIRIVAFILLFWFLFLNLFQSQQYRYRSIHWDAMTKDAYFGNFMRILPVDGLEKLLAHPDISSAMKGEYRNLTEEEAKEKGVYYVFTKKPKE